MLPTEVIDVAVARRKMPDEDDSGVVQREGVGVVLDALTDTGYAETARRLVVLLAEPELREACRATANAHPPFEIVTEADLPVYDSLPSAPGRNPRTC